MLFIDQCSGFRTQLVGHYVDLHVASNVIKLTNRGIAQVGGELANPNITRQEFWFNLTALVWHPLFMGIVPSLFYGKYNLVFYTQNKA